MQLLNLVVQEKETKNGKAKNRLQERQIGRNCTKKRSKTSIHESIVVLIDILTIYCWNMLRNLKVDRYLASYGTVKCSGLEIILEDTQYLYTGIIDIADDLPYNQN